MRAVLCTAVLLVTILAGCASKDAEPVVTTPTLPDVPVDWALRALAHKDGHDHFDAAQHADMTTPNFEIVGWDPLVTAHNQRSTGDYYCGGVADTDGRDIAVTHSFSTDVAMVLSDVTDRSMPKKLGEIVLTRTHVYDADILPDASFVVLALSAAPDNQPDSPGGADRFSVVYRSACSGKETALLDQDTPYQDGVLLIDIRNPEAPVVADFVAQPGIGVHSIFATIVDGTKYVLASTTNLLHQASYFSIFTITTTPLGGKLQPYGVYQAQYVGTGAAGQALMNGHVDGWIQKHPGTEQVLAYLANWDGGLIIVRMEGPGRLTTVGVWNDHAQASPADLGYPGKFGQIHDTLPMEELWDGKHYTFIGQEVLGPPEGRPTGQIIMMDTTNPATPTPVARWTLPVMQDWGDVGLLFSTHYIEVVDRTLFVSMYHGGVWAVGTAPVAGTKELPTLGVFVPSNKSPAPPAVKKLSPEVLDVLALKDGLLVSFDGPSGVYVYRFKPEIKLPEVAPWTQDAWIG